MKFIQTTILTVAATLATTSQYASFDPTNNKAISKSTSGRTAVIATAVGLILTLDASRNALLIETGSPIIQPDEGLETVAVQKKSRPKMSKHRYPQASETKKRSVYQPKRNSAHKSPKTHARKRLCNS